jgi:flagellar biosynthesis chaperone FliJ
MSPYQYRLQPLLDLKVKRRQELERAVADRQRELAAEKEALAELKRAHEQMKSKLAEALRARLSEGSEAQGYTLGLHTYYLRGLTADVKSGNDAVAAQRVRVGEFQDRLAEARRQLADAAREVEVLNKHRERLEVAFLRAADRKEALEQDEMGNFIFNRRRGHESPQ